MLRRFVRGLMGRDVYSPTDWLHMRQDVPYLSRCGWSSRCGLQLTYSTPPRRPVKEYLQWKGVEGGIGIGGSGQHGLSGSLWAPVA